MPYDKVGQESSGPIGLYYRTIGQGATDREALIRVRRASDAGRRKEVNQHRRSALSRCHECSSPRLRRTSFICR